MFEGIPKLETYDESFNQNIDVEDETSFKDMIENAVELPIKVKMLNQFVKQ